MAKFRIIAAVALLVSCGPSQPKPPEEHVSVAYPIVRKVVDWDDFVGRFQAPQTVTVTPRVSGTITEVLFRDGQDVKVGQKLFIVDPRPFRAVYDQAVANLDAARAALANARSEFAHAQALISTHALSQEIYDMRLAALLSGKPASNRTRQLSKRHGSTSNSQPSFLRSPAAFPNVWSASATSWSQTRQGLTTIVSLDPIWFAFEGAESFYLKYARQDVAGERRSSRYAQNPVEIQLADETSFPHRGRMAFVDNAIDPLSGTIKAYAEVPNPPGSSRRGCSAACDFSAPAPMTPCSSPTRQSSRIRPSASSMS